LVIFDTLLWLSFLSLGLMERNSCDCTEYLRDSSIINYNIFSVSQHEVKTETTVQLRILQCVGDLCSSQVDVNVTITIRDSELMLLLEFDNASAKREISFFHPVNQKLFDSILSKLEISMRRVRQHKVIQSREYQ
jgi:hypothetical protein